MGRGSVALLMTPWFRISVLTLLKITTALQQELCGYAWDVCRWEGRLPHRLPTSTASSVHMSTRNFSRTGPTHDF